MVDTIAAPWLNLVGVELGWAIGIGLTPASLCTFRNIVDSNRVTCWVARRALDSTVMYLGHVELDLDSTVPDTNWILRYALVTTR